MFFRVLQELVGLGEKQNPNVHHPFRSVYRGGFDKFQSVAEAVQSVQVPRFGT